MWEAHLRPRTNATLAPCQVEHENVCDIYVYICTYYVYGETHMHIHRYIHMYIYVYVCVMVCDADNMFTPEKCTPITNATLAPCQAEPIFGAMYSTLCSRCAEAFPEFPDEADPSRKPHTFKRLLLNKCVHTHTHTHMYIYIYIWIYGYRYRYIGLTPRVTRRGRPQPQADKCVHIYIYMYTRTHTCMCICMYVYIYLFMYM